MSNNPFEVQPRGQFYAPTGPVLMTVGDVAVTGTEILLPFGRFPLSRSVWVVRDNTRSERRTPGWAIVFAIGGVLFLGWVFGLGLLFLFFLAVKETMVSGHLEIELTGPNVRHITQVPIPPTNFPEILIMSTHERVGYIRSLAARLG